MRVYVDIKNIKFEDLRTLYAIAETTDGRRMTVGADIAAWAIDEREITDDHLKEDNKYLREDIDFLRKLLLKGANRCSECPIRTGGKE